MTALSVELDPTRAHNPSIEEGLARYTTTNGSLVSGLESSPDLASSLGQFSALLSVLHNFINEVGIVCEQS